MELIAFFLVWAIITVVGHGSWVLIRAFFRIVSHNDQPLQRLRPPNENADIVATRRVVRRLVARGVMDETAAAKLHYHLRDLENRPSTSTIHAADQPVETGDREEHPESPITTPKVADDEPIMATLADEQRPRPASSYVPPVTPHDESTRESVPVLSKSEVIRSFLEAHNIRWGELVAGMLIVVCSIGLVISLWSSLVERHRVIPSLIFLGANAAIYAAGLYTLSRWRLRHTSRAVLVIATLLVPLSVLAGLAAAGTTTDAVQLTDPITLAAIALASVIYVFLLYRGGKALSSQHFAAPIALSVAGPVAVLPLVPATVRALGPDAGWIIGVGSIATLLASTLMVRLRHRTVGSVGVAGGRARLLAIAFGGFALAVAIGYCGFAVWGGGMDAMLAIAVATIPALVALAASSRSLMTLARSSTQSMTGAVLCVLLIALAWTLLPPSMTAQRWVWSWALVFSISSVVVGWQFRQHRWLALATLPLGMAATFSAPVWLGGKSWESIALWQRLIGGEPMIAASLVAILVAGASRVIRDPERRRWMGYAALLWASVSVSMAAMLSVSHPSTLGIAPWWSVTVVLIAGIAASVILAMRHHAGSLLAIAATLFTWLSVFWPIQFGEPIASADVWMMTTIAIATTLLALRELVPKLAATADKGNIAKHPEGRSGYWFLTPFSDSDQRVTRRSARMWESASAAASITAGVIACLFVNDGWVDSALTLAAASALLFWASTASRSVDLLRISQAGSVALAAVIGYGRFRGWLFDAEAWTSGIAVWGWAITVALVAGFWMLIRQLQRISAAPWKRRVQHLASPEASPMLMPDGWAATIAAGLVCIGSAWVFAALLAGAGGSDLVVYESRFALPIAAFSVCGAVIWAVWRVDADPEIPGEVATSLLVAAAVWCASQLGHVVAASETTKLVIATTLAAVACLSLARWLVPRVEPRLSKSADRLSLGVSVSLVAISSAVLLVVGWLPPITAGTYADALPTIAVATWWMIGSGALLWKCNQTLDSMPAAVSAVLAPAAAAIVVPVFSLSHPAVWIQIAAITALAWLAVSHFWLKREHAVAAKSAMDGSTLFALAVGIASSLLVTIGIVLNVGAIDDIFGGPASFTISALSIACWCLGWARPLRPLAWQIGLSLMAGQIGWLTDSLHVVSGPNLVELISAIWIIASAASLIRYRSEEPPAGKRPVDFFHVGLISVIVAILTGITGQSQLMPWLSLAALVIAGLQVAFVGGVARLPKRRADDNRLPMPRWLEAFGRLEALLLPASRVLGWFVIVAGGIILSDRIVGGTNTHGQWTMMVVWTAIWVVVWRLVCPDRKGDGDRRRAAVIAIPDMEWAAVLLVAVVFETVLFTLNGRHVFQATVLGDPLLWERCAAYFAAGASALGRSGRRAVWSLAIGTAVGAIALLSVQAGIHSDATHDGRFVCAALPSGFAIAFISHWLPAIALLLRRLSLGSVSVQLGRLVQATWQVALVVAGGSIMCAVAMITRGAPATETNLTIIAVALCCWATAEMAEILRGNRLRHAAVTLGLITIGLWASVDSGETSHAVLTASMRWLVASVFTIPMLLFGFPKLLGESISTRWREAFQRGAMVAGIAAACSLIGMIGMEAAIRTETGIEAISNPLVMGVAVTLGILSALAALIAIASGPASSWRDRLELADQHRTALIIAAQAIGAITWLHVFLCKPHWAFIGLREYWPYIVMGLAFISVGVTEWARRRRDQVMSDTLSHTALYLPLLPVIGFWLSGEQLDWTFRGGRVPYELLLAIGSVYYIGIASMWKGVMPRVAAVVLGNAAWWVVLVQQPGWGFLAHPQVWLIPPAVCVLVVSHLYRDRLEPAVASGIRYASTLVIYISSTADMLLQQIGTNLSGPIILVLLALAGMAAGVVLRVRPFLYLGALFVFLGVTSMVWHAHLAIDAVWPWWVFGITTGMCLLAGLMALEKNKPRLREYANQLATWQG